MIKNIAQQEKIRDLSSRLVYGIYVKDKYNDKVIYDLDYRPNLYDCIPYLRPMSSMSEKEKLELLNLCDFGKSYCDTDDYSHYGIEIISENYKDDKLIPEDIVSCQAIDWLYAHYFDIRGLIEKGLALPAPKDMYN